MLRLLNKHVKREKKLPAWLREGDYDVSPVERTGKKQKRKQTGPVAAIELQVKVYAKKARKNNEPNHYYLDDLHDNDDVVAELEATLGINKYIKTKNAALKTRASQFKIAPVPVLGPNQWGIFTTKDIIVPPHEKVVLGEYRGEKKAQKESNFVFMHGHNNKKNIDALRERNWIPMINTVLSAHSANVKIVSYNDCVDYYLEGGEKGLMLPAGTQLLCFYGDDYDIFEHPRFMRQTTSWRTAQEIVETYPYFPRKQTLDADFLALFDIPAGTFFAVPNWHENSNIHPDYMPYLACSLHTPFVTENQREDITLLMIACWQGDIHRVKTVLRCGADPNAQSLIAGQTAFHVVARSSLDIVLKMQLIQLLSSPRYGGLLCVQDKDEKSILHWAVESEDIPLIDDLAQHAMLWNCMDKSDRDSLEYPIAHGKQSAIPRLVAHLDNTTNGVSEIITYYLAKDAEDPEEKSCLMLAMDHFCQQTSCMIKTLKRAFNKLCLATDTHALKITFFSDLDKLQQHYVPLGMCLGKSLKNTIFSVLPFNETLKTPDDYTFFRINNG